METHEKDRTCSRRTPKSWFGGWRFSRLVPLGVAVLVLCGTTPAFAQPEVIHCYIDREGWDISGARLVRTWMGYFDCNEFVRHRLTSKVVKKRLFGWKDYDVKGKTTQFDRYWPEEPFDHSIQEDGTFHVYLEDLAETIDGRQAYIVREDGPPFVCVNRTCRRS